MRIRVLPPLVWLVALSLSCGGDGGPTSPTPSFVHVSGVWALSSTVTSTSGGECFAPLFQSVIGSRGTGSLQIQQSGATLSAVVTDDETGGSCSYTGTAGSSSIALNTNSCTSSDLLGATCPNGAVRNIRLQTGGINGTVAGSTISGTAAETYNVTTSTGAAVGTLTINYSFTANRR